MGCGQVQNFTFRPRAVHANPLVFEFSWLDEAGASGLETPFKEEEIRSALFDLNGDC